MLLTVGRAVQLTASVTLSDGTRSDATTQVAWQSSDVTVATVSSAGLLTTAAGGETDVTATIQGVQGRVHVAVSKPIPSPVTPPLTYEISGAVHESAPTQNVALPGATVGIHFVGCPSCPHDNETTTTGADGHFTLPGIDAAGFTLVVSKPGYETALFGVVQLPRDVHPDIGMLPPPGQVSFDITGTDPCIEHPRDPFYPYGRTMAEFAAHRDGLAGAGPGTYPFSIGVGWFIYSISSSGEPVIATYGNVKTVAGGTRYFFLMYGDVERCGQLAGPYRIPFQHPR
jgi:hypothetical protein